MASSVSQDGPWSVSVAEAPYDSRSFSVYIKTPTHNITLTRTATAIVQLDVKLRASQPAVTIPLLPTIPTCSMPQTKRKSTFLNALARLSRKRPGGSSNPSPLPTPAAEQSDPFLALNGSCPTQTGSATSTTSTSTTATALAAYLTTVSNIPSLRHSPAFRRFMRVRTDDLQSTRAERPHRRVRPDLLAVAHLGVTTPDVGREGPGSSQFRSTEEKSTDAKETCENGLTTGGEKEPETRQERPVPTRAYRSRSASAGISRGFTTSLVTHAHAQTHGEEKDSTLPDCSSLSSSSTSSSESTSSPCPKSKPRPKPLKKCADIRIEDFDMMRVLGKGCAGKVLLVRKKDNSQLYALKAITKRHVLAHQELMHTLTEQAVLKRLGCANAEAGHPFVVKLWWSFHDKENLFLVLDFHPGGDLATQLSRWGRLGRDRARFYTAEIVEGVEGLHRSGIIYRDLKPENILIAANGHIVLTDFGLSKEFVGVRESAGSVITAPSTPKGTRRWESVGCGAQLPGPGDYPWRFNYGGIRREETRTFCGTAEYLAPEVIQGLPYSYEVDWWALGTLLYEMLVGITPFWASSQVDMYQRVLEADLKFPESKSIDADTRSFLRGLLHRNPHFRLSEPQIKQHPYFSMIDWSHVYHKRYIPPYIPPTDPSNASDTQNFDAMFLDMEPVLDPMPDALADMESTNGQTDSSMSCPSQTKHSSADHAQMALESSPVDLFDGYSYKGGDSREGGEESDERSMSVYSQSGDGRSAESPSDEMSGHPSPTHPTIQVSDTDWQPPVAISNENVDLAMPSFTSAFSREPSSVLSDMTVKCPSVDEVDEEDDWDLVEPGAGSDRNGAATTLFSRGVVDRYRLAFKKDKVAESPHARRASKVSELSLSAHKLGGRPIFRRNSSAKQFLHLRMGSRAGEEKEGKHKKLRPVSVDMGRLSLDAQAGRISRGSVSASTSTVTSPTISNSPSCGSGTTADTLTEEDEDAEGQKDVDSSSDSSDHDESVRSPERRRLKKGAEKVLLLFSPSKART